MRQKSYSPFVDNRGTIEDLLRHCKLEAVTRITTRKDAIRGNHYHQHTIQWTYVLSGRLRVQCCPVDDEGPSRLQMLSCELKPGELWVDNMNIAHAWQALEDTVVLVFTEGPRSGDRYEDDVVRLAEKDHLIRRLGP